MGQHEGTRRMKTVIIAPVTPWSSRAPNLMKKGHKPIHQDYVSRSNAFDCKTTTPSDIHLFYEMYEPKETRPRKLFYKILGNTNLPDLTEYEDSVTGVDFAGRLCSTKRAFEVVRRLPKCTTVTFVIGEKEHRECPVIDEEDKNDVLDLFEIPHVTKMDVLFPSRKNDTPEFLKLALSQISKIFRQARHHFPNIEVLEVSLPPDSYKDVKDTLPRWKRLKFNYDVQIIQETVSLAKLSTRDVPLPLPEIDTLQREKSPEEELLVSPVLKPIQSSQKVASGSKISGKDGSQNNKGRHPNEKQVNVQVEEERGRKSSSEKGGHPSQKRSNTSDHRQNPAKPYRRSSCDGEDPYDKNGGKRRRLSSEKKEMSSCDKPKGKLPITSEAAWETSSGEEGDESDIKYNCRYQEDFENDDACHPYHEDVKPEVKMEKYSTPPFSNRYSHPASKSICKVTVKEWSQESMDEFEQQFTRRQPKPQPDSGEEIDGWEGEYVIPIVGGVASFDKLYIRR